MNGGRFIWVFKIKWTIKFLVIQLQRIHERKLILTCTSSRNSHYYYTTICWLWYGQLCFKKTYLNQHQIKILRLNLLDFTVVWPYATNLIHAICDLWSGLIICSMWIVSYEHLMIMLMRGCARAQYSFWLWARAHLRGCTGTLTVTVVACACGALLPPLMVEALDQFNDSSVDVVVGEVCVCRAIRQYRVGDRLLHHWVHSHGRRRREAIERIVCVRVLTAAELWFGAIDGGVPVNTEPDLESDLRCVCI